MDYINIFLEKLSNSQIQELQNILSKEIEGDIDYFLFKIKEFLNNEID